MPTPSASLRGQADIGYTGQRLDNSTGLMYYRARYYAQGLGRFISADTIVPTPSNPQSLNRFAYVRNNPLKLIDPSGHKECEKASELGTCESATNEERDYSRICAEVPSFCMPDTSPGHLAQLGLFFIGGMALSALAAPEVIAAGVDAIGGAWATGGAKAAAMCVNSRICAALLLGGAGGGAKAANAEETLNTYGPKSNKAIQIAQQALKDGVNPQPGFYDVLSHGSGQGLMNASGQLETDAAKIAEWIQSQSNYVAGTPVRLVACSTGCILNGIAQRLANAIGVPVMGATTKVDALTLQPMDGGIWKIFKPK
jgi:RHS repeat-associated protein